MSSTTSENIPAPSGIVPNQEGGLRSFMQDGADFYDYATGNLVASYQHLVANDYDLAGATAARAAFIADYPNYRNGEE